MTEAPTGEPSAPDTSPLGANVPPEMLRLLIAGRWAVLGTVALAISLALRFPLNFFGLLAVAAPIAIYNLVQWLLLRAGRLRIRPAVLIGIDLVGITLLDWFSGGVRSPFVGFYYVLIIVAAAFGDLRGSLATATAVAALESVMALLSPSDVPPGLRLNFAITTFPFFFLTALGAGFLVRRLREQWERRRDAETALEAMHREVAIAREVQATLTHTLPPRVPGFSIGAHLRPLHGIGGDMQDYVPVSGGIGIAVADVSGHSLAAALLAARLAHLLDELGLGAPLPSVLASWNQTIYERTPPEVFVTAVILIARADNGEVEYAVAGHPPPLVYYHAEQRVRPLEGKGMILGVLEEARVTVRRTHLNPGDVLLLYTDGAIDARDDQGAPLGIEGLAALFAQFATLPVQELVDRLGEAIAAGHAINDDLTLVALVCAGSR